MRSKRAKAVLAATTLCLIPFTASVGARGDENRGRPLPVSCLHHRLPSDQDAAGKRPGITTIEGVAVYPALKETFRGATGDSMAIVVILLDWDDKQAARVTHSPSHFRQFLFQNSIDGRSTLRDYYREVSTGRFRLGGMVSVWLRSAMPYGYYVNSDRTAGTIDDFGFNTDPSVFLFNPPKNVWGIVREAVHLADAAGVDFRQFDNDGPDGNPSSGDDDGVLDGLIVVHSGSGAERFLNPNLSADNIWSHKSDLRDPFLIEQMDSTIVDGIAIGPYVMVPELGQLGVYVHEFGHILGLPDLYGTFSDGENTIQQSLVGSFCLMDAGGLLPLRSEAGGIVAGSVPSHINSFFKEWLGWIELDGYSLGEVDGTRFDGLRLEPAETADDAIRLLPNPGGNDWNREGSRGGEFFVLEYRRQIGFDAYLPGSGLLIWHVNESRPDNDSRDVERRLLSVVEADDREPEIGTEDLGSPDDIWPFGSRNDWTPTTSPSTDLSGGRFTGISVNDIRVASDAVTFDLDLQEEQSGDPYVFPNPFRPDRSGQITLVFRPKGASSASSFQVQVFDLGGTLVRDLDEAGEEARPEEWRAFWDGENDAGEKVASGVYLYVIRAGDETRTGKIALLR